MHGEEVQHLIVFGQAVIAGGQFVQDLLSGRVGHQAAHEIVIGFELGFQGFGLPFGFRQGFPAGLEFGDVEEGRVVFSAAG